MKNFIKGFIAVLLLMVYAGVGYASASPIKEKAPPGIYAKCVDSKLNFTMPGFDVADNDRQTYEFYGGDYYTPLNAVKTLHYGLIKYSNKSKANENAGLNLNRLSRSC